MKNRSYKCVCSDRSVSDNMNGKKEGKNEKKERKKNLTVCLNATEFKASGITSFL